MRRAVLLCLLVALAAGCGNGGGAAPAETEERRPGDPGLDVVTRLVRAVRANDAAALWELLSKPSRRRAGGSLRAFREKEAGELAREIRPFLISGFDVVVSERITDVFGVVAIARDERAWAGALRLEGAEWKLELPGPLTLEVLGPRPGSRGPVGQIGVEVHGRGAEGNALLYLDGVSLVVRAAVGPASATVFANLASRLAPGLHNAVAFANRGGDAAASAWTFRAT